MKKRVFALAMAAVMTVGLLAGCGEKKVDPTPSASSNGEVGTPAANAIKVGGVGPLTGGAAIYGNAAARGAQIAADEINAANPDGLQIDLRYEDDAHDAEKSVNAYNTLKGWGMQIFLGSVTSTPGVATSSEANRDKIFYLTPSASSTDVLGGVSNPLTGTVDVQRKECVYQMCFVDPNQGSASAQYIADQNLGSSIAVIYKNDDVYSTGVYNSFAAKAEELKLNVVSVTTFTEDTKTDFSVQLNDAKAQGADLVFLPMYYDAAALIFTQANAMDYAPKWFGIDGMDGILGVEGFDTSLAEGVMLLTPFNADAEDEATRSFVSKYQEKYGEIPNQFAADAYDCVYAIYNALVAGNATPDMSAADLSSLLIEQFNSMTFDGLTGEGMTWDVTGAVSKSPKGMVIQNGAYVGMD